MSENLYNKIHQLFDNILEPQLKWPINTLNLLKSIQLSEHGDSVKLQINVISKNQQQLKELQQEIIKKIKALNINKIEIQLSHVNIAQHGIDGVKHVIFVASGKGGVGKSTVAVNLSLALLNQGAKVGLLDADIYGPSIPSLLHNHNKPEVLANDNLEPVDCYGLKVMSIGNLIAAETAVDWRGQLSCGTIVQFIQKTHWQDLDYLIIDLPPGTGDIVLTLAHKIKSSGVVMVTLPNQLVWTEVQRSLSFFKARNISVLAIVENMSHLYCECGRKHQPFLSGNTNFIQEAPIHIRLPVSEVFMHLQNHQEILFGNINKPDQSWRELQNAFNILANKIPSLINNDKARVIK